MQLKSIIEAALLAAGRTLTLDDLTQLFDLTDRPSAQELRDALDELAADCASRGIELSEVSSGYRLQVRRELAPWISRLWEEKPARYSRALLETLALIAYRQPVTRGDIEDVRGVAVNPNIIRTLQEREWVRVVGHRDVPGRPELLATTREFLDYFGLKGLDALPTLAEIKDFDQVNPEVQLSIDIAPQDGEPEAQPEAGTSEAEPTAAEDGAAPEEDASLPGVDAMAAAGATDDEDAIDDDTGDEAASDDGEPGAEPLDELAELGWGRDD